MSIGEPKWFKRDLHMHRNSKVVAAMVKHRSPVPLLLWEQLLALRADQSGNEPRLHTGPNFASDLVHYLHELYIDQTEDHVIEILGTLEAVGLLRRDGSSILFSGHDTWWATPRTEEERRAVRAERERLRRGRQSRTRDGPWPTNGHGVATRGHSPATDETHVASDGPRMADSCPSRARSESESTDSEYSGGINHGTHSRESPGASEGVGPSLLTDRAGAPDSDSDLTPAGVRQLELLTKAMHSHGYRNGEPTQRVMDDARRLLDLGMHVEDLEALAAKCASSGRRPARMLAGILRSDEKVGRFLQERAKRRAQR